MFAVVDSGSGAVIGEASLRFDDHPGVGELGYWLGEDHHGCGHGRATVELLTRAGFERLGAFALTARVKEGNEASIAVLTAAGFDPVRAPRVPGDPEDPPIAWIFSTTRRGDGRRSERPTVAFSMPKSG
jgi:RimJ/RimL family protein N-acetyltransferase